MPGVGKTSLGSRVASETQLKFIDLDEAIEHDLKESIQSYIASKGLEFFRIKEAISLRKVVSEHHLLIACGGGCPCYHDNISFMNTIGNTIFLDLSLYELIKRFEQSAMTRPLMKETPTKYLTKTFNQRLPYYAKAKHTLQLEDDVEQNVNNIISLIKSM